eukprot:TRINITY_DN1119_c0_g1_i1.p2 TRINITY_DN1119_c0_g1~~TRINITY_DN1119_c0_g1_i1.p2  ORF type:complete len:164 (-),score=20.85 TRINITY_DN1119_c0_g1_i1:834-1325(-)
MEQDEHHGPQPPKQQAHVLVGWKGWRMQHMQTEQEGQQQGFQVAGMNLVAREKATRQRVVGGQRKDQHQVCKGPTGGGGKMPTSGRNRGVAKGPRTRAVQRKDGWGVSGEVLKEQWEERPWKLVRCLKVRLWGRQSECTMSPSDEKSTEICTALPHYLMDRNM